MQQVPLGKTGAQVSALCLGCLAFGTTVNEETAYQLLDQYFEQGGRFLDTANNYSFWVNGTSGGESEELLGRWMKDRHNRDEIFLATKVGARPTIPGATDFAHIEGLSAQAIEQAIDGSLMRLGTDHIDLYYAHIDDRQTPLEETLEAFERLIKSGKVRHIGCSNMATWRIAEARTISKAHNLTPYCCVEQRYSYLRPKPGAQFGIQVCVDDGLLDYCNTHDDFALLAYSPLLSGSYTRQDVNIPQQYLGADSTARLEALHKVAHELGVSENQVVLAWLLQSTPRAIPIIAASHSEQLSENLAALKVQLSAEQIKLLTEATA
ncbi:aldo/keto reductase [Ktedonosporobacter rubrisoli]|uniref:Aldo/keto reductase n=1 Tax=Ktedonosporobacter rubrisoli TaxID=2509675 RepID=A0A4P6K1U8_KTERU|nr:aldo/keto reductase [Ktedonosporobacter rubrisoli]QBD81852.1 aldo/keto reductase [Ktedonosporobacter rubrisoli]